MTRLPSRTARLLDEHGIVAVNVMASPGAGKTSLILRTIEALRGQLRVGVIEGDVAGRVDADKVAETGTPVVQINTGGGCHLDAPQVQSALAAAAPGRDRPAVHRERGQPGLPHRLCPGRARSTW